jgi:hypothetical protein
VYIDLFHPLVADLSISTGQDFDRVELRDHQAGGAEYSNAIIGNIEINTGHGDDYIAMSSVAVIGNVEISTGNGRDVVQFNSVSDSLAFAGSNDILGNLSINTGVDIDQVNFERFATNVEQNLDLELGQGNDALWGGINLLNLANGTAFLSGGQGYDTCPDDLIIAAEIIKIGFED